MRRGMSQAGKNLPQEVPDVPTATGGIPVVADGTVQCHPDRAQRKQNQKRITALMIAVLTTLSAVAPFAIDTYIPAFPVAKEELNTTQSLLQFTLTSFFIGTAVGQIVAGPLSDRFGRRKPLLTGILVCLLASLGCAFSPNITALLWFRMLQGIGGGFGMVLGRAVLIDMTEGPELFRLMNIMQGVNGIAPIIAPIVGGIIIEFSYWRNVFYVSVAMSLISLIGIIFLIPESLPPERRHGGGMHTFLKNCRILFGRRDYLGYLLVNAFSAMTLMAYVSASSFVVQDMLGFSASAYSLVFACYAMGLMSMSLLSARLNRSVPPRSLIRIGLTMSSAGSLLLLLGALNGTPAWAVLPGFLLAVPAQGFIFGNGAALASSRARDVAGTASALLGLGFSFSASFASPLVGVAGSQSSLPMALVMCGGAMVSVTMFILVGRFSRTAPKD
ncbi:multidrug effflux MFS transporter [Dermabacteraceae bacterium P13103]